MGKRKSIRPSKFNDHYLLGALRNVKQNDELESIKIQQNDELESINDIITVLANYDDKYTNNDEITLINAKPG